MIIIFIVCELIIWALNSGAIYADSKIYGYYYPGIVAGMLLIRFGTALAKGIVLGAISQPVLKALAKYTGNGLGGRKAEKE